MEKKTRTMILGSAIFSWFNSDFCMPRRYMKSVRAFFSSEVDLDSKLQSLTQKATVTTRLED